MDCKCLQMNSFALNHFGYLFVHSNWIKIDEATRLVVYFDPNWMVARPASPPVSKKSFDSNKFGSLFVQSDWKKTDWETLLIRETHPSNWMKIDQ